MFPHTITIFRHVQTLETDTYNRYVLKGVYWYGNESITVMGNGIVKEKNINIVIPKELVNSYKNEWDVKEKDYIVLGEVDPINSMKELNDYDDVITVTSVNKNICDSDLNNIIIVGK